MEYRRLGGSGLYVSALSYGSWVTFGNQVDLDAAVALLKTAYDAGVNFFDNAEVYAQGQSEEIMGNAVKRLGWARDTYCVSSKVFWGGDLPTQRGLNRKHVFEACHAALKRLRVDYLDLFFCHRPDYHTPIEETVRAMSDLVQQGKVMYWGTSEWSAAEIMEAHGVARELQLIPPTMEQPQYNMLHRDRVECEYLPLYDRIGLGTTIWSPLASGILTGKYKEGKVLDGTRTSLDNYDWLRESILESERGQTRRSRAAALESVATDLGTSMPKLAIAWAMKNPNVSTVILGASKVSQLEENLTAPEVVPKLTPDVIEKIEAILQNKPEQPTDFR